MDYSIKKEPLFVCETIFDGIVEQPVDLDFSLPDYCPDIQNILKCQIRPQISSKNISGDKLYVDGNADIILIYLDEEKSTIRCCEHTCPFSTSINLNNSVQDAIVIAKTKIEYVNCRAVTPRRLDIHGAFSIHAKVKCKKEKNIVCDIDGIGIEKKKISSQHNNLLALGQQYFNIAETIDKGTKQPDIEYILKTSVNVNLQDYKTLQNKVMINAEANVKIVYISDLEYSNVEIFEHSIPISQIVDIEGVQDDCNCDIVIEVLNHNINIKPNDNGENNLLLFECKMEATVSAYEEKDVDILTDIYSIDYESEPKYEKISISNIIDRLDELNLIKGNIDINDNNISEIIDASGNLANIKIFIKDQKIKFDGKINICVLAKDENDIPVYLERLIEFSREYSLNNKSENIFCEENVILKSCNCRLIGKNSVEIIAEIQIGALIYVENKYMSVTDIFVDEEKPREKDKKAAITLYYADDGEEIWDIARKYCTSVDKIKKENEIDTDKLQNRNMLFIPM